MNESSSKRYKRWEEVVVSHDKGKREVHYYLTDGLGGSDLAVIGKERSLRHMTYRTVEGFVNPCHVTAADSLDGAAGALKWKTRREVIDWLAAVVSDYSTYKSSSSPMVDTFSDYEEGPSSKIVSSSKPSPNSIEFSWLGSFSICKKKRKHYRSFCRRGITISVHDFVLIMGEDNKRLVAYVEDLYEDSKGTNMVSVQWFHKADEITDINLPQDVNINREIFFSFCFQELIIECIDGLASVLSQPHFDRFCAENPTRFGFKPDPFVCKRQIDNGEIKGFDVTGLSGYWSQETLRSMFAPTPLRLRVKIKKGKEKRPTARWQLLPGQQVEVLSQDSGIKGCWFRCLILRKHQDRIKVRYLDVPDADNKGHLEEWVWSNRVANKDELEVRMNGRMTVRPVLKEISGGYNFEVGSVVDARWLDGWWEGIIICSQEDARFHVYFPEEKRVSIFAQEDLRQSHEWVGDKWHPIDSRKDIIGTLPKPNLTVKCETKERSNVCASSPDLRRDLSLDGLKWSARKRRRFSPNANGSSNGSGSSSQDDGFVLMDSLSTMDHDDNCKNGGDSALFGTNISIGNLVMSQ